MRTDKLVITVGARAGRQAGAHGTDGPNTQQHTYHTPLPAYGVGPQAPLTTHMYLIGQEFLTCGTPQATLLPVLNILFPKKG